MNEIYICSRMADLAIHKLQLADHPTTHHAHDNEPENEADVEVAYVTGDSELTYISGKSGAASKLDEVSQTPLNDFVDFQVYRVNDIIVQRGSSVVFADKTENLVKRLDTKSQGFEWVLEFQWVNETTSDNNFTITTEEGLTIREGQETESNFGVSAAFKGLGINVGGSRKTFTSRETSSLSKIEKHIVAEAKKTTYFYQKRYNFLQEVWFWQKVPNWENHNHFRVGANVTYNIVKSTALVSIISNEFATLNRRLSGITTIGADSAPPISPADPSTVRQFQNITKKAKTQLNRWGFYG